MVLRHVVVLRYEVGIRYDVVLREQTDEETSSMASLMSANPTSQLVSEVSSRTVPVIHKG